MIEQEGEPLNPESIVHMDFTAGGEPRFPAYQPQRSDPFLQQIQSSGEKWVVLVDGSDQPKLVMDADGFLRDALFSEQPVDPGRYCHRPIVVTNSREKIGGVLSHWSPRTSGVDNVIDNDMILYWRESKKVITGADILGRLLKGIAGSTIRTAHA